MECQDCAGPATVHLTDVIGGVRRETHLCDDCAARRGLFRESRREMNLPAVLQLIMGDEAAPVPEELARRRCPHCGASFADFRANGWLGCPADYDVFRAGLEPLLQRIHRATGHAGKTPARGGRAA